MQSPARATALCKAHVIASGQLIYFSILVTLDTKADSSFINIGNSDISACRCTYTHAFALSYMSCAGCFDWFARGENTMSTTDRADDAQHMCAHCAPTCADSPQVPTPTPVVSPTSSLMPTPSPTPTPAQRLRRAAGKSVVLFAWLMLAVGMQYAAAYAALRLGLDGSNFILAYEFIGGISCTLIMLVLFALKRTSLTLWRPASLGFAWKLFYPFIGLAVVFMLLDAGNLATAGHSISNAWLRVVGTVALQCLGVGLFEETLYRGILFGAVLRAFEHARYRLWASVIITSLIFGISHIAFGEIATLNLNTLAQATGKVLQTGILSLVFCLAVWRTKSLAGALCMHALFDFLLMLPSVLVYGTNFEIAYVSQGEAGIAQFVMYCVLIAISIPFVYRAVRIFNAEQTSTPVPAAASPLSVASSQLQ